MAKVFLIAVCVIQQRPSVPAVVNSPPDYFNLRSDLCALMINSIATTNLKERIGIYGGMEIL